MRNRKITPQMQAAIESGDTVELIYIQPAMNKTVFGPISRQRYKVTTGKITKVLAVDATLMLEMRDTRKRQPYFDLVADDTEAEEAKRAAAAKKKAAAAKRKKAAEAKKAEEAAAKKAAGEAEKAEEAAAAKSEK